MVFGDYIALSLMVIKDLRVLGSVLAILLAWALFRFVGTIATRRPRPPVKARAKKAAAAPPPKENAAPEVIED